MFFSPVRLRAERKAGELDKRREVGVLVKDAAIVKELIATFEADWAQTGLGHERKEDGDKAVETVAVAAAV